MLHLCKLFAFAEAQLLQVALQSFLASKRLVYCSDSSTMSAILARTPAVLAALIKAVHLSRRCTAVCWRAHLSDSAATPILHRERLQACPVFLANASAEKFSLALFLNSLSDTQLHVVAQAFVIDAYE
jgi:hypothetical protein